MTWAAVGGVLSILRWRRNLIYGPVFVLVIIFLVPAAHERLLQGFTEESIDTNIRLEDRMVSAQPGPDLYTVTSGRVIAWPLVIEKILESPVLGYGKQAMKREGISMQLITELGESFPHPHNMYLEWLLDNGIIGFLPVIILYLLFIKYSLSLFLDSSYKLYVVTGGFCASLILALLAAGMGSQTFYPREGSLLLWCAIGLMLRLHVQREAFKNTTSSPEEEQRTIWSAT